MKKGKYAKRGVSTKGFAMILAVVALVSLTIGGTLAWLTAETNEVTNTFNTSTIGVQLNETTANYKMIPGWTISKDPKAKVTSDSEDCYLFIEVEEKIGTVTVGSTTCSFDDFIAYAIEDGWETLNPTTYPGVYYKVINEDSQKNVDYNILGGGEYTGADGVVYTWADNEVLTKPEVTKEMMAAVQDSNKPILSFTAYAVQLWKSNEPATGATNEQIKAAQFTAEEAWLKVSPAAK